MQLIIDVFGEVDATKEVKTTIKREVGFKEYITKIIECDRYQILKNRVKEIQTRLKDDKKASINEIFRGLKKLDFGDKDTTRVELIRIKTSIVEIENYFKEYDKILAALKSEIDNYDCFYPDAFIAKYIFNAILEEFTETLREQKNRLNNLQTSYDLCEKVRKTASTGGGEEGLRWCLKLDEIPSSEGKISLYTIKIKENGYKISDNEEIVGTEAKDITGKTLRIRKFQRFIPEVSVGMIFTFYKYNTYGTTSDSTGQQYVAQPTVNKLENLNISAMINWNLFCQNSNIHPLIQTGVGVNSGMPSFLVGAGLRFSNNSTNRMRITGGLAMTWIKELDKLKVGDKVLGTADIDNDLKYSISPKLSPYIGLQYNF